MRYVRILCKASTGGTPTYDIDVCCEGPFQTWGWNISNFELYGFVYANDRLLNMPIFAPNENQCEGNLVKKRLSDISKVNFGAKKDYG